MAGEHEWPSRSRTASSRRTRPSRCSGRGIDEAIVRRVLAAPEQRNAVRAGRDVLQSRIAFGGKSYLVRLFVDVDRRPAEVVTVYRTSDIALLEGGAVKATYDARTDTLSIVLKAGARVAESGEDKPGVILDYDADGNLVSLEILDASKRVTEARRIEFETVE
jgi:uncharacterized protein YuzE